MSQFWRGLSSTAGYAFAGFGSRFLKPLNFDTPDRRDHGLVLILSGIEGAGALNYSLARGLNDAGLPYALQVYDWNLKQVPAFMNLMLPRRRQQMASRIATMLSDYQDAFPERPIYLIGHSGGAAMIPYIAEELPPGLLIERAVMVAAALSPHYDFVPILPKIKSKLICYTSLWDLYFLRFGTSLVGTLDRRFGFSGGCVGFYGFQKKPENEPHQETINDKYQEVPYHRRMMKHWHYGGHLSCMNRVFAEQELARWFTGTES